MRSVWLAALERKKEVDRQGIELAHIDEAVKEAERRGRDIAALDIRKGAAPNGGVIIIDDDLEMVRELSFKQISNRL